MGKRELDELAFLNRAEKELNWFGANYDNLISKYESEFIAISGGSVIASSRTMDGLVATLKRKNVDPCSVMTKYITKAAIIL